MKKLFLLLTALPLALLAFAAEPAADAPKPVKYQITGLFSPDREADLREIFTKIPQVKLTNLDFKTAEATLEYDAAKVFPGAKPAELVGRLDNLVKSASNHTFGVKPLSAVPQDKLERIEIAVAGLDCKGCSLAAYDAIYKLDGVETVTVSFREGRIVAAVDAAKTNRATLVEALKKHGVEFPKP